MLFVRKINIVSSSCRMAFSGYFVRLNTIATRVDLYMYCKCLPSPAMCRNTRWVTTHRSTDDRRSGLTRRPVNRAATPKWTFPTIPFYPRVRANSCNIVIRHLVFDIFDILVLRDFLARHTRLRVYDANEWPTLNLRNGVRVKRGKS